MRYLYPIIFLFFLVCTASSIEARIPSGTIPVPDTQVAGPSQEAVFLFPNPARDYTQVSLDRESALLRIHSLLGHVEVEKSVIDGDRIYLGHLRKGLYIARFFDDQSKLIKTVRLSIR